MIGGLILAAGEGRRFGGPKQLAELDGRPLLHHAVEAMRATSEIERIVVVLGAHAEAVGAGVDLSAVEAVVCREWAEGQAASLRCGLRALESASEVVITLADQPFLVPQVIAGILAQAPRAPAVRATYHGRPGHPVLLRAPVLARAGRLRGDAGARDLLREVGAHEWEVGHLGRDDDIDTPAELEVAQR